MNVLHITDVPACDNYTAGIVQKHLIEFLLKDGHTVTTIAIKDKNVFPEIPKHIADNVPYYVLEKPCESYGTRRYGNILSFVYNNYNALYIIPLLQRKIKELCKGKHFDIIWSVVQGQTMIKLIRGLAKQMDLPYSVEVWDPPQWWLSENRFDRFTFNSVMKEFGKLIHESQYCLAASDNMAEAYTNLYKGKCIPVIPSLNEDEEIIPIRSEADDEFIIGFAGQIYAINEFNTLIEALNLLNWQYKDRKIKVVLYGEYFSIRLSKAANVELRGWRPQKEVLSSLAGMDLLYCPYWFSDDFSIISRLSFPSKLTTYLKTKTPVLVHAPEYASSSQFISDGTNGYVCDTNIPDQIKEKLKNIIDDSNKKSIGIAGYQLFRNKLVSSIMKNNFYESLGIK